MFYCFFFFKQKTAYEVCGRDWSSDVCSSDLVLVSSCFLALVVLFCHLHSLAASESQLQLGDASEIGRASCRERV